MKKLLVFLLGFLSCLIYAQEENLSVKNSDANSVVSDFGVSYYGDDAVVFASTRRKPSIDKRIWRTNKQPYLELYKGTVDEAGEITNVEKFSAVINTKYHESNLVFTNDLKTVYFTRNNYLNNDFRRDKKGWNLNQLYKADLGPDGMWSNIQKMPFNSDEYQTGHPALNKENDKLFFISDMPGSIGSTDIYVVDIMEDGSYSEPRNLGPSVNTEKKEMFPFIDSSNRLYYSSNGLKNDGEDLDIYVINDFDQGELEQPMRLNPPFNSEADDFGFIHNEKTNTGYFSSNRKGGKGDDDIYYFSKYQAPSLKCYQEVQVFVRDIETKNLLEGTHVELAVNETGFLKEFVTDSTGSFKLDLNCNTGFKITANKEYYEGKSLVENTGDIHLNTKKIIVELVPNEFVNKNGVIMVNINPIYFDLDKSEIRIDAEKELAKVYQILNKYPNVIIDLGSHTDSRARDQYNLKLSERRVKSSIDWLINKGISAHRLKGKGYGETQLVNKCANGVKCTEAEHQQNRRTEFVIVNPEVIK